MTDTSGRKTRGCITTGEVIQLESSKLGAEGAGGLTPEQQLDIISRAWGRQQGYCFFPSISGSAKNRSERIQSYREGPPFRWPRDREEILKRIRENTDQELYWCPNLFEAPSRQMEFAMDEHALWADLDQVDPRTIQDYPPTIAWETSPGRYQALWLTVGMIQGAAWPGRENQCLTYHLGADPSGWDATQLLRIPSWINHKPEYLKEYGHYPEGHLLWKNGRTYQIDEFNLLPDVPTAETVVDIVEDEVDRIDRHKVWSRLRLKVSKRVREFMTAREPAGNRSEILWEIERELADAGASILEIVALMQPSVWNKYRGRSDELRRLTTEASKAVSLRSVTAPETKSIEELASERPDPTKLFTLLRNITPPRWLVKNAFTQGASGFIGGEPKTYKTWIGLELALSVATGTPFLGHFEVIDPGPVLYIQEEDPPVLIKQRVDKIWPNKISDRIVRNGNGEVLWVPGGEHTTEPPIDAYINQNFVISDEAWQSWLDETMSKGQYHLVILDPLMMMLGEIDEFRAQQMTTHVFRPLKQLARKHDVGIIVVHHMKKADPRFPGGRGGQKLLGSVAGHAWAEDSMYVKTMRGGDLYVEQESKSAPVQGFRITHLRNRAWQPMVIPDATASDTEEGTAEERNGEVRSAKTRPIRPPKIYTVLQSMGNGYHSTNAVAEQAGIKVNSAYKQLTRLMQQGKVAQQRGAWTMNGHHHPERN